MGPTPGSAARRGSALRLAAARGCVLTPAGSLEVKGWVATAMQPLSQAEIEAGEARQWLMQRGWSLEEVFALEESARDQGSELNTKLLVGLGESGVAELRTQLGEACPAEAADVKPRYDRRRLPQTVPARTGASQTRLPERIEAPGFRKPSPPPAKPTSVNTSWVQRSVQTSHGARLRQLSQAERRKISEAHGKFILAISSRQASSVDYE